MNRLTCIIIDDEPSGRIVLKELIKKRCPNISIIGEAEKADEAYEKIKELKPDFILLDIQMPGGTGFDLLRKFDKVDFEVIFVTSYDKYAVNAFKFSAVDYLLKPVEFSELKQAIDKISEKKNQQTETTNVVFNFLDNINNDILEKKLAIHDKNKVRFVNTSQIVCIEAMNNYTEIYTADGNRYTTTRLLKEFEEFSPETTNFCRISRGVIINLNHIKDYTKGEECIITLSNNMQFEISRRKKIELNDKLRFL